MNTTHRQGMILSVGVFLIVAILDYNIGKSVSLWALYLLPVGLVSWHGGLKSGWAVAVLAEVWVFLLDCLLGSPYENYISSYSALLTESMLFFALALMVTRWRDAVDRTQRLTAQQQDAGLPPLRRG